MKTATRELYSATIAIVSRETGVSESDMLLRNTEECADARFILVKTLSARMTDMEIASMTGKTRQCVNAIRNDNRVMRWGVRTCYDAVQNAISLSATVPQ